MACRYSPAKETTARTPSASTTGPKQHRLQLRRGLCLQLLPRRFPTTAPRAGASGSLYVVSEGNTRIYVGGAARADGHVGSTANLLPDRLRQALDAHLARVPVAGGRHGQPPRHGQDGGLALSVRSDNSTQPSDVYLQNSAANPAQSTSLEKLLAAGGVQVVFNGHAHTYQRITPNNYQQNGQVVTYVTGGGGAVLEPVSGQTTAACKSFLASSDIYAIGWSPTNNAGSSCGTTVPFGPSLSAAQVYNFLKVTVNGGTVTVTPINAAGQSFDQKTYNYSTAVGHGDRHPTSSTDQLHHCRHLLPFHRWRLGILLQSRRCCGNTLHQPGQLQRTVGWTALFDRHGDGRLACDRQLDH